MKLFVSIFLLATVYFIPYGAIAKERNPWPGYMAAIDTAAREGREQRYENCMYWVRFVCNQDKEYCLTSLEKKIQLYLQGCYDKQLDCLDSCSDDYQTCKDTGTPLPTCGENFRQCNSACEATGRQCQLDAIGEINAIHVPESECEGLYQECVNDNELGCLPTVPIP